MAVSGPASAAFDAPDGCEQVGVVAAALDQPFGDDEKLADPHNMEVCRWRTVRVLVPSDESECTESDADGNCVEWTRTLEVEIVRRYICEITYHSHGDPW